MYIQTFWNTRELCLLLKNTKKKINVQLSAKTGPAETKVWSIITKGNKAVKLTLAKSDITPTAVGRWNSQFDVSLCWKSIFFNVNKPLLTHS